MENPLKGGSGGRMIGRNRLEVRSTQWGMVMVVLVILVLVNLTGLVWHARLDFTEEKEHTLSESTRILLSELDDNILVKGYFTPDLPPPYNRVPEVVEDLLDEYGVLSDGRVSIRFEDPAATGPNADQEMMALGIPKVQVTDVDSDKLEVKTGYMGLVLQFADKREIIPVVQDGMGLEYMVTSRIRKLTGTGRRKLVIAQGFGAVDARNEIFEFRQLASEQYEVVTIELEKEDIPDDADVVMLAQPQNPLTEEALARLDRFMVEGGGLAILTGGVLADLRAMFAQDLPDRFGKLLSGWGITVAHNLVSDPDNLRVTISQQKGLFTFRNLVDYPLIPVSSRMAEDSVVVADLEQTFLPFVSTLTVEPVDGITHTPLIMSSPESHVVTAPYNVDPLAQETAAAEGAEQGSYTLAVAAEGDFPSVYAASAGDGEAPDSAPAPAPGRLLVVGSGDLIRDAYMMNRENLPFLINAIDWLSGDASLIALRSRGATARPLAEVSDGTRQMFKVLNIVGGALFLILVGLARWRLRVSRRRQLEAAP